MENPREVHRPDGTEEALPQPLSSDRSEPSPGADRRPEAKMQDRPPVVVMPERWTPEDEWGYDPEFHGCV